MSDYIDTAKVAKIARTRLKERFSNTKFSVRSKRYAGGSSVDVSWTDGPTRKAVQRVVGHLHGAEFNGMEDIKEYSGAPYLNDFIFCDRAYSSEAIAKMIGYIREHYVVPKGLRDDELSRELLDKWHHWTLLDLAIHELNDTTLS